MSYKTPTLQEAIENKEDRELRDVKIRAYLGLAVDAIVDGQVVRAYLAGEA